MVRGTRGPFSSDFLGFLDPQCGSRRSGLQTFVAAIATVKVVGQDRASGPDPRSFGSVHPGSVSSLSSFSVLICLRIRCLTSVLAESSAFSRPAGPCRVFPSGDHRVRDTEIGEFFLNALFPVPFVTCCAWRGSFAPARPASDGPQSSTVACGMTRTPGSTSPHWQLEGLYRADPDCFFSSWMQLVTGNDLCCAPVGLSPSLRSTASGMSTPAPQRD